MSAPASPQCRAEYWRSRVISATFHRPASVRCRKSRSRPAIRWRRSGGILVGYDVMYWTDVQRSGGLIDTTINPNLIPPPTPGGPARSQPVFNTSPLLAEGFNVGVRYNYLAGEGDSFPSP